MKMEIVNLRNLIYGTNNELMGVVHYGMAEVIIRDMPFNGHSGIFFRRVLSELREIVILDDTSLYNTLKQVYSIQSVNLRDMSLLEISNILSRDTVDSLIENKILYEKAKFVMSNYIKLGVL